MAMMTLAPLDLAITKADESSAINISSTIKRTIEIPPSIQEATYPADRILYTEDPYDEFNIAKSKPILKSTRSSRIAVRPRISARAKKFKASWAIQPAETAVSMKPPTLYVPAKERSKASWATAPPSRPIPSIMTTTALVPKTTTTRSTLLQPKTPTIKKIIKTQPEIVPIPGIVGPVIIDTPDLVGDAVAAKPFNWKIGAIVVFGLVGAWYFLKSDKE